MKKNRTSLNVVVPPVRVATAEIIASHLASAGLAVLPPEVIAPLEERLQAEITTSLSGAARAAVDRAVKRHLTPDAIGKLYVEQLRLKAASVAGPSGSAVKQVPAVAGGRG
jgi:hypothetical protein